MFESDTNPQTREATVGRDTGGGGGLQRGLVVLLIQLTVVLAAAVGVREVAFTTYRIPSESMEHPLEVGNRIGVEKVSQWWRRPARGDVIVFWPEGEGDPWVKRVVAVGGGA